MNQLRDLFASHTDDGYLKAYALFCNPEAEMKHHPLAHIKCPTLVITGDEDLALRQRCLERWRKICPMPN